MRVIKSGIDLYGDKEWTPGKRSHRFQSALITLLMFVLGGQRKQVVLFFKKDVSI
jgi:hypothetical protein